MAKHLDPKRHAARKQASRDRDQADIASGRASPDDVQRRNRFLNGIDAAGAVIQDWKDFE